MPYLYNSRMTQRFCLSGFLLLTAILSGWLVWHYVMDLQWEAPANPHHPDAFVNKLQVIVMNEAGLRQYQFTSPYMLHYAENDRSTFTLPHLVMFEENAPPWTIDALQGEALQGHEKIKLWNNVGMVQSKGAKNLSTTIKTEAAVIYPKQRLVTTDKYISAVQPNAEAEGVGMKLDLTQKTLDLLSQVRGNYVSAKK